MKICEFSGEIIFSKQELIDVSIAMAWAIKTGRTVIYQIDGEPAYKLPDHHNKFGEAWWIDSDIPVEKIKCVFSADSDA